MNDSTRIDLRNEKLHWTSMYTENGNRVYQIVFENTVIILSEEQIERLAGR